MTKTIQKFVATISVLTSFSAFTNFPAIAASITNASIGGTAPNDYIVIDYNGSDLVLVSNPTPADIQRILDNGSINKISNIELGAGIGLPSNVADLTKYTTLTGTIGGKPITLSSLTLSDWTKDLGVITFGQKWFTEALYENGFRTLNLSTRNALFNLFQDLGGFQRFGDPNISYVTQDDDTGTLHVGISTYYDAKPLLVDAANGLLLDPNVDPSAKALVEFLLPQLEAVDRPIQIGEPVKYTYDGTTEILYGFNITPTELAESSGVSSNANDNSTSLPNRFRDSQVKQTESNNQSGNRNNTTSANTTNTSSSTGIEDLLNKRRKIDLLNIAARLDTSAAILELIPFNWARTEAARLRASAANYRAIAQDPPDPNFTTIAQPVISSLPRQLFTATDLGNQQSADAFNALLNNLEQSIGIGDALLTSLERAGGALEAGDTFWENQQKQAANKYSLQLSGLLGTQPQLFANFANAYKLSGLPTIVISSNDIIAFQNTVRTSGLPTDILQSLIELGTDSTTIEQIRQNILAVDPYEAVALGDGKFPDLFTDPAFIAPLLNASEAFNQGIAGVGVGTSTSVPEPCSILGLLTLGALGAGSQLKRRRQP